MKNNIDVKFNTQVWKEGGVFVSYAPQLDVSSCGNSIEEARKNIREAIEGFLEEAEAKGTLNDILEESGFVFQKGWVAPDIISYEQMQLAI